MTDRIDDVPLDDDLLASFERLERIDPPDTWARATSLASSPAAGAVSTSRWWAVAAAAVLVVGGVVAVAAVGDGDTPSQQASTSDASETAVADPIVTGPTSDADDGVDTSDFGSATIEPSTVSPGDEVTVSIVRDDDQLELDVTLTDGPS